MKNIRLNYRYRDAHNYKELGSVVFANPAGMSVEVATALLREKLISGNPFSCKKMEIGSISVPPCRLAAR